jgi:L-asparaginase type I
MTKKITILTTGGTISQQSGKDGVAAMGFDPTKLASDLGVADVALEAKAVFQKGSKDVTTDDWKLIASFAAEAIAAGAHGIVVLHGTDTLHYTAAALSFMLQGLSVPVVLTGSMIPGGDVGSDSLPNLRDAVRVAAEADLAEVCIVFSADRARSKGLILRGNRARKVHSHAIDAFRSINAPPLGLVEGGAILRTDAPARQRSKSKLSLALDFDDGVVMIKLNPAVTPAVLARLLRGAHGAVLEGTGIGHVRTDLQDVICTFGAPVIISTQCIEGGERLGMYAADRTLLDIPNVVPVGDMTSETALVKLMFALMQGDVASFMRRNIAGEIADRPSR